MSLRLVRRRTGQNMVQVLPSLLLLAALAGLAATSEPNPPTWPDSVHVLGPDSAGLNATIQSM